jgi:hypothetical protein
VQDQATPDLRQFSSLIDRCASIDIEVDPTRARIQSFAAVTSDTNNRLVFERGNLFRAIGELDAFTAAAEFLLGHNIILFDLPHLEAAETTRTGEDFHHLQGTAEDEMNGFSNKYSPLFARKMRT